MWKLWQGVGWVPVAVALVVVAGCDDDPAFVNQTIQCAGPADTLTVGVTYSTIDTTMFTTALSCGSCGDTSHTLSCWKNYDGSLLVTNCTDWQDFWPGLECVPVARSLADCVTVRWKAWSWDGSAWQPADSGLFTMCMESSP